MGHILTTEGVEIDDEKVVAIQKMTVPKNIKQIRSFLGMINYLSKFINNLSDESKVIRDLEKHGEKFEWTQIHQKAFEKLKKLIGSTETLKYFDPNLPIKI